MSDVRDDLERSLNRLSEDLCSTAVREAAERGEFQQTLWDAACELGLDKAALSEDAGGFGFELADTLHAVRLLSAHAVPLPVAETMVAGRLLEAAGLTVPEGALTVALGNYTIDGQAVTGVAPRVPAADHCTHAVVATDDTLGLVALGATPARRERNLAAESRMNLEFASTPLIASAPLAGARDRALCEAALMRSVQLVGAMEGAMRLTIQYTGERVQFGRPIAKFQAVQQMVAVMAGEVAAASAGVDFAIHRLSQGHDPAAIAVAKARASEAAGKVAEIAHQTLGAMGITREHGLHYRTRRLWAWREEFGNEAYWQARLGAWVCARGAAAVWPLLSEFPSTSPEAA